MSGQRLLVVIIILAATASLTTCQRWPNFQELFHRLKMYQSNPRGFRLKSGSRLPSPAPQVSRRENSLQRRNDSAEMSYNQKKAALKDLLIKSAGTKQSNVAPLALGLLQKLKGRPLQANKHFDKQASQIMSKPLQIDKHFDKQASLPNKIMSKPLHTNKHSDKQASMLAGKLMSKPS